MLFLFCIFAKIRNKNNTKYRGISFREIFVATVGTLIHEKKLRSKISCQTPFKPLKMVLCSSREIVSLKI
jgi:hypothetical protein